MFIIEMVSFYENSCVYQEPMKIVTPPLKQITILQYSSIFIITIKDNEFHIHIHFKYNNQLFKFKICQPADR